MEKGDEVSKQCNEKVNNSKDSDVIPPQRQSVSLYLAQPREFASELTNFTALLNARKELLQRKMAQYQQELA